MANKLNDVLQQQLDRHIMKRFPDQQGPPLPDYTPEELEYAGELANAVAGSSPGALPQSVRRLNPFTRLKSYFSKPNQQLEAVKDINPDLYRLQKYGEVTPGMLEKSAPLKFYDTPEDEYTKILRSYLKGESDKVVPMGKKMTPGMDDTITQLLTDEAKKAK